MRVGEQIAYFGRLSGLSTRDAAEAARRWMNRLGLGWPGGQPHRHFTVAVTAQAPPAVAAAVRADANAAGLQVTAVTAADRAAAVRSAERGSVTAAVTAGGEIIWKARPNSTLNPVLNAAVRQAIILQRAAGLGLSADATTRLLAPVQITVTQLHSQSQRTT